MSVKPEAVEEDVDSKVVKAKVAAEVEPERKISAREAALFVCKYVPYINSAYDLVFDKTPTADSVKDLLNLIGLINALMLGIAFSVVTAVDYGSAIEADERFMTPSSDPDKNGYYELYVSNDSMRASEEFGAPSAKFLYDSGVGIVCLFNSLIITLLGYMDIVHKDFDGETPRKRELLMESWWKAGRWLVIAALVFGYFGVVKTIVSFSPLVYLLFPDYPVERSGELVRQKNAPYEYMQFLLNTAWLCLNFALICMGIGTALRYHEEDRQKKEELVSMTSQMMVKSSNDWTKFFQQESTRIYFHDVADEYLSIINDCKLDFEDRGVVTDQHLQDMGIEKVGHRVKLLRLIADSIASERTDIVTHSEDVSQDPDPKRGTDKVHPMVVEENENMS